MLKFREIILKYYKYKYVGIKIFFLIKFLPTNIIYDLKAFLFKKRNKLNQSCSSGLKSSLNKSYLNKQKNNSVNLEKKILIVDDSVPQFDRNAGDRTVKMYIDMFIELGYIVTFLPNDFLYTDPYSRILEEEGVAILYGSYYKKYYDKWIEENIDKFDFVFINRPTNALKYINILKHYANTKIFYYGMDIHFIRQYEYYKLTGLKKDYRIYRYFKAMESYVYKKADALLTISQKEQNVFKEMGYNNVYTFPVYYYKDLETKKHIDKNIKRENLLFVGSGLHFPNQDAICWFIEYIFPKIKEQINDISLTIVGNHKKEIIDKYQSNNIIFKSNVSDKDLLKIYNETKIVVIPIRFGAGVKGKTIEALYNEVPIVSTDYGLEGLENITDIVESKNTEEEFANEVIRLYSLQKEEYNKTQDKYRVYIEKYFSYEKAKECMYKILYDGKKDI